MTVLAVRFLQADSTFNAVWPINDSVHGLGYEMETAAVVGCVLCKSMNEKEMPPLCLDIQPFL